MSDKRYNVLLAGESWVTTGTHIKGFDQFSTVTFHLGAEPLVEALKGSPFALKYMPSHEAQRDFPQTPDASPLSTSSSFPTSAQTRCSCILTPGSPANAPRTACGL